MNKIEEEIDTFSIDDEIICPYCGHKFDISEYDVFQDSYDTESEVDVECEECGKTFLAQRETSFTYQTYKKEGDNSNNG